MPRAATRRSRLTWDEGDRTLTSCPRCGQAVRVDLHGSRLDVRCFGGCGDTSVLEALHAEAIVAELRVDRDSHADRLEGAVARSKGRLDNTRRVVLTPASAITPEPLRWLWRDRLPLRGLSLIAGEPGLGKSTLTVELAADVTHGRLEGDLYDEPRDVLIATAEDHFASVVWGRLTAAGADMRRVHRVHVEAADGEELLTLPDDVIEIETHCARLAAEGRPVALIAVDPVSAFIGGGVDTHRDAAVRRVLAPLAGLAERQDLAVTGVAHLNKDQAAKLLNRVGGSVAFGAAPRSVLAFARHPDDSDGEQGVERVIVHAKSNHGRYAPSLAARIESRDVPTVGDVSRLVIVGECQVSPEDLGASGSDARSDREAATEWLADELADGEWHTSREVKARARATAVTEKMLRGARERLGVEDRREGFPAVSEWRLAVMPTRAQPAGTTIEGTTAGTRTPEPKTAHPGPQSRPTPETGTTERIYHLDDPSDIASLIVLGQKVFPGSYEPAANGGRP